ncbi:MAG: hypothetical protein ACOC10_00125 [Bacteroidota bacterium]
MAKFYAPALREKLAHAKKHKVSVNEGALPNDFISLSLKSLLNKKLFDARQIRMIIATSIRYKMGTIFTAYTPQNNLCAAVLMLRDNTRLIKYVSLVTPEGKELCADVMLTDAIIKRYAEKPITMTFEDIGLLTGEDPSMYGAIKSTYPRYKKWRIMPIFIQ